MRVVSICGSHGVGKTTLINAFKRKYPEFLYISESTRNLIPKLGYSNPYDFVDKYGISFYESIIIGQWGILPYIHDMRYPYVILDRSPVDNLAYYFMLRNEDERQYELILTNLCKYFCEFIDSFIFVPTGVFELVPDSMQVIETQIKLEKIMKKLLLNFNIEPDVLRSPSVEERMFEMESILECYDYSNL